MVSAARWVGAVLLLAACSSSTEPRGEPLPADAPGKRLIGLDNACPDYYSNFSQCLAWSSDSKTLYVVLTRSRDTVLAGVDIIAELTPPVPLAGAYTVIFPVGRTLNLATSQDPTTIFVTRPDSVGPFPYMVMRMSLVNGKMTRIAGAGLPQISVSPDGTALAYHASRGFNADTVVLVDAATGTRRAEVVTVSSRLRGISPDGKDVALQSYGSDAAVIWHSATGALEPVKYGADYNSSILTRHTRDVQWTNGGFSTLYQTDAGEVMEISVATGAVVSYGRHKQGANSMAWAPAASRVFSAEDDGICYIDSSCYRAMRRSSLQVSSLAGVKTIGSVYAGQSTTGIDGNAFPQFVASPDGRYLAYLTGSGSFYLVPADP